MILCFDSAFEIQNLWKCIYERCEGSLKIYFWNLKNSIVSFLWKLFKAQGAFYAPKGAHVSHVLFTDIIFAEVL